MCVTNLKFEKQVAKCSNQRATSRQLGDNYSWKEQRERERDKFCVINVKYKEISWRVRRKEKKKKSNFQKHRVKLVLKKYVKNRYIVKELVEVLGTINRCSDFVCSSKDIVVLFVDFMKLDLKSAIRRKMHSSFCEHQIYFFRQITTFIKVCMAFVVGLQTL